ncbi:MAG TPA: guanitoxin biosynthesis heme-dependent pre-guanitoxin N-hydroxylase GntA [Gemmatimonadaceae bacterium]
MSTLSALPDWLTTRVREDFLGVVAAPDYSCLGARSSLHTEGLRVELYGPMSSVETTASLAGDLAAFARGTAPGSGFVAMVALFAEPAPESEDEFEQRLWRQLTDLRTYDERECPADVSSDPADPRYAFSFCGSPFFVIGMHPGSSRLARRVAWPALVFNPHRQFSALRDADRFESFRAAIRKREIALQGTLNPNLADAGEATEARQYSGRAAEPDWRCPFHHSADDGA